MSIQEKIQEKINERINFLEDLYSETMKIDDEKYIYDKYTSLRRKIRNDCLFNFIYCNVLKPGIKIDSEIKLMQKYLEEFNSYLFDSQENGIYGNFQDYDVCNEIDYLYLPSLSCYLTWHSKGIFGLSYKEEDLSYFSIIDFWYSVFNSFCSHLKREFIYGMVLSFEEALESNHVEAIKYLAWDCWALIQKLKKSNDGNLDIYVFSKMKESNFLETSKIVPKSKKYNEAYLKSVLLKTIEKFKTSLEAYEKLDVDYKDIIEYIINNPDLNKEDIDSKLNSSSGKFSKDACKICKILNIFYKCKNERLTQGFEALKEYAKCLNRIL